MSALDDFKKRLESSSATELDAFKERLSRSKVKYDVDDKYVSDFSNDVTSFFNDMQTSYKGLTYGASKDAPQGFRDRWSELNNRAGYLRAYLNTNQDKLNADTYGSMISYLDSFDKGSRNYLKGFEEATNYYSQFKDEKEYNAYLNSDYYKNQTLLSEIKGASDYDVNSVNKVGNYGVSDYLANTPAVDNLGVYLRMKELGITSNYEMQSGLGGNHNYGNDVYGTSYKDAYNHNWSQLTDEEIKAYYYIYNTKGLASAKEYLAGLNNILGQRKTNGVVDVYNDASVLGKIAMNIATIPATVVGGLYGFQEAANVLIGEESNPYSPNMSLLNLSNAIRGQASADIDNWSNGASIPFLNFGLGEAYQSIMSGLDSAFGVATMGPAYTALMGTSAFATTATRLQQNGGNDVQVAAGATCATIAEILFENFSIENLISMKNDGTIKTALKNIAKQAGIEFSEEFATEFANIVSESVIMQDKSEFMGYADDGGILYAIGQSVAQIVNAGIGGALSGGLSAGAHQLGNATIGDINAWNNYRSTEAQKGLIESGLESAKGTLSNTLAGRGQAKLDNGKNLKPWETRRLIEANELAMVDEDKANLSARIEERLRYLGENTDVKVLADAIAKKIANEDLSLSEKKALKNGHFTERVVDELSPNNQLNKSYDTDWTRGIETQRVNPDVYTVKDQIENTIASKRLGVSVDDLQNKVSESGKVEFEGRQSDIKAIKSVGKNKLYLEMNDGTVVDSTKVRYASDKQALLFESMLKAGYPTETANAFINAYKDVKDLSVGKYLLGIGEAYRYGKANMEERHIRRGGFYDNLPSNVKEFARKLGREDIGKDFADQQARIDSLKGDKIVNKGGVDKSALVGKMTKIQRASTLAIEQITKEFTHNKVEYFESVVKNGKRVLAYDVAGRKAGTPAPNGIYDPETGTIYIDINAGPNGEGVMLWTYAHELTHFVKQWSPAKFKVLADFLFEEYGKKGYSVDALARRQMELAKKNGRTISYDTALEEVVADSMSEMLTDTNLAEKIAKLKAKDEGLVAKIKEFFSKLLKILKGEYSKYDPMTPEAKALRDMQDSIEKITDLFAEAIVDAGETFERIGLSYDAESKAVSPTVLSERTWTASEYVRQTEIVAESIAAELGVSKEEALKYIKDINSVAKAIADDRARLDYDPNIDPTATVLKPNSDYKWSVDMSTLCAKRLLFTGTFDAIQRLMPNTVFDSDDIVSLRKMMMGKGYQVACGPCYVESTRREIGDVTNKFIERYKASQKSGKPITWFNSEKKEKLLTEAKTKRTFIADKNYTPTMADLNTTDIDKVKVEHPDVYAAYLAFMNARGQNKPKLLETRAEYKGEILKVFERNKDGGISKATKDRNAHGGLRLQSFSDFEIAHLIDMMQVVMDMSRVGLKSQAYTKVPTFAEAFGNTGIKINLSLIAKGDGIDSKGRLIFDDVEGINSKEAFRLRDKFSKNVGTILVGKSDAHIIAAMADPRIDYIIPFHKSQWKESLYEALGLTGYEDYTDTQHEKPINPDRKIKDFDPIEYWDFSKSGDENAQIYLEKCREDGRLPKFPQFQNYPGYWKLLIDFKMYDNDGVGSPQTEVRPIFDNKVNQKILKGYEGGHRAFPVAQDVVDEFVKSHQSEQKFSDRSTQEYLEKSTKKYGDVEKAAIEHFGLTDDFRVAGYILTDGRMLDFSGAHWLEGESPEYIAKWKKQNDIRQVDHEDIYEAFDIASGKSAGDNRLEFLKRGNIRISPEAPGIDIATEPTAEQYEIIRKFLKENPYNVEGFYVDIEGETKRVEKLLYSGKVNADKVISDIKYYYANGTVRDNSLQQFLFSDRVLMGSLFSGGGTLEKGLIYQMVDKEFAVEWDGKIAELYKTNNGADHLYVGDVQKFDSTKKQNVFYLHASPSCKAYSKANNRGGEAQLDIDTATATARILGEQMPTVFTMENVPEYEGSTAYNIIADKLKELGYNWDVDVYDSSDYGNATSRKRLIIRAVKDGLELPSAPDVVEKKTSWGEATKDLWKTELEPSHMVESMMKAIRNTPGLKNVQLTKLKKPIIIMSTSSGGTVSYAYADQVAPTVTTKCGDARVIMDGKVYRPTPEFIARLQGFDDYKFEGKRNLTARYTVMGNGIPAQLTKAVMGGVLDSAYEQTHEGEKLYSDRDSEGNVLTKEQMEFFKDSKLKDENGNLIPIYRGTRHGIAPGDTRLEFYSTNSGIAKGYAGGITDELKINKDTKTKTPKMLRMFDEYRQLTWAKSEWHPITDEETKAALVNRDYQLLRQSTVGRHNEIDYFKRIDKDIEKEAKKLGYTREEYFDVALNDTKGVFKAYANLVNPIIIDAKGRNWDEIRISPSLAKKYGLKAGKQTTDDIIDTITIDLKGDVPWDGIIIKNVVDYTYGSDQTAATDVIPLKNDVVKSAYNTEPTSKPDVRYSDRDSQYLELAKNPEKNRAELQKMVDEKAIENGAYSVNGEVVKLNHGTDNEFTEFSYDKMQYGGMGFGVYLSDSEQYAGNYRSDRGKTLGLYLMTNNLIESYGTHNITSNQVREYLDKSGIDFKTTIGRYTDTVEEWVSKHDDPEIVIDLEHWAYRREGMKGDTVAPLLKEVFGYDGMVRNRADSNEFVVWDTSLVKSADPVTYDDNGNIIPLSERFNENNADIRYSDRDLTITKKDRKNYALFKEEIANIPNKSNNEALKVLNNTPKILQQIGMEDKAIFMTVKHYNDIIHPESPTNSNWHGLTTGQVNKAPVILWHPAIIADSNSRNDSVIVISDILDNKKRPIIISIFTDGEGRYGYEMEDSNFMTSMYGRKGFNSFISSLVNDNKILYIDRKKAHILYRNLGVQFPLMLTQLSFDNIIHQSNNIVKENIYTKYLRLAARPWENKNRLRTLLNEEASQKGYSLIVDAFGKEKYFDGKNYRSAKLVAYDNSGNVTPLNKRFSDRTDSSLDTRTLLSNALASTAQNDIEKKYIADYQSNIDKLNDAQNKLAELRAEIKKISFGSGKRDMDQLRKLQDEATKLANRITIYDKKLLNLESTKPLKDVVTREKAMAVRRAEAKSREELKAYKEKALEKQQKVLDDYKQRVAQSKENAKERDRKSELRKRIQKMVEDLNSREFNPKTNHYIPAELMKPVNDLLYALNVGSGRSERVMDHLYRLKAEYDALRKDARYATSYDETVADMVDALIKELGLMDNPSIYNMEEPQLLMTYNTLTALLHTIKTAIKVRNIETEMNAMEISSEMRKETSAVAKASSSIPVRWLQMQLRPETMFERFADFKKNSMWSKVYQMLNKGQLNKMRIEMESNAIFKEVFKSQEYIKSLSDTKNLWDVGIKDEDGDSVLITRGMALALYKAMENEDNFRHLMRGGFTIPDLKKYYSGSDDAWGVGHKTIHGKNSKELVDIDEQIHDAKKSLAGADDTIKPEIEAEISDLEDRRAELYEEAETYMMEVYQNIREKLTGDDLALLQATMKYFDEYSKNELNKTTMELYGFEKALVKGYLPIHTDPNFRKASFESITKDMNLENSGFMKDRVHASNPILLEDLSDIINSQIEKTATYCGFTIPVKDFGKIYGKTEKGFQSSLQDAIVSKFGESGKAYIENLLSDIVGSRRTQSTFLDRARGYMAGATLSINPRVALAQAASYPTAAAELGWGPLRKAMGKFFTSHDLDLIAKYSPLLYNRSKGADVEMGDIKTMAQPKNQVMRKLNWLMGWIEAIDKQTVGTLWYASQYYVDEHFSDLAQGTDEYYTKVAEVFNNVVERTQPNYAVLQRPDILRNPNAVVKQLTMFMTQRLQNFNIVFSAASRLNKYQADYEAHINDVTEADVKEAKEGLAMAITSQLIASGTIVVIKFLVDAVMHSMKAYRDDDDELTFWSIFSTQADNLLDTIIGNLLGGSELYKVIRSIVLKERYYGISLNGVGAIADAIEDFVGLAQKPSLKKCNDLAKSVCTFLGIPLGNAEKIGQGLYYWIKDAINGELYESDVDRTATQDIRRSYKAYSEGNTSKFKSITISDKNQSQVTSYLKPIFLEAYDNKDNETMALIRRYMSELGIYNDVVRTTQTWIQNKNK